MNKKIICILVVTLFLITSTVPIVIGHQENVDLNLEENTSVYKIFNNGVNYYVIDDQYKSEKDIQSFNKDGNLLSNPSFEEGQGEFPDGWQTYKYPSSSEAVFLWDSDDAHLGEKSVGLTNLYYGKQRYEWQTLELIPFNWSYDYYYEFTVWYKHNKIPTGQNQNVIFLLTCYDENQDYLSAGFGWFLWKIYATEWSQYDCDVEHWLDYIKDEHPSVFEDTRFVGIELGLRANDGDGDVDPSFEVRFDDVYFNCFENHAPEKPSMPSGPTTGKSLTFYTYSTLTNEPDGDEIYYMWDYGDGSTSGWMGAYHNGEKCETERAWSKKGTYEIKVKAKDQYGAESEWSDPLVVSMPKTIKSSLSTNEEVVDQKQDYNPTFMYPLHEYVCAQSFTPTLDSLSRIDLYIKRLGNPSDETNITVAVRKDLINGEDITMLSIQGGQIEPGEMKWVTFDVPDISIENSTTYYIVCYADNGDEDNYYGWLGTAGHVYDGGKTWTKRHGTWCSIDNYDFCFKTYGYVDNYPPEVPVKPEGPINGNIGTLYTYSTSTTDKDEDTIYYLWDWGDGTDSGWLGPFESGEPCSEGHSWSSKGTYNVRVKCKDDYQETDWSDPLSVSMPKTHKLDLIRLIHNNPILIRPFEKLLPLLKINMETTDDTEYWGLLIAVGEYLNNPVQDRPSMLVEVENLYQSLISSENWNPSHIRKIKGENANLENILEGFKWLLQMEDENDISLVYITTHGGFLNSDYPPKDETDGKDEILVPYEGFDDTSKFLWDDEINFILSLLESKGVCFIVDSCYSGGFNDALQVSFHGNEQSTQHFLNGFLEDLAGDTGRVILMSSEEDEVSYGSTFSHYICQGLEGAADANQDMCASAEEVFQYAEPFILQHGRQHPTMVDAYQGELLLTGEISMNTNIKQTLAIQKAEQEKNKHGIESEWSDFLRNGMPKNKTVNAPFLQFLENHPRMFPMLRQLLLGL